MCACMSVCVSVGSGHVSPACICFETEQLCRRLSLGAMVLAPSDGAGHVNEHGEFREPRRTATLLMSRGPAGLDKTSASSVSVFPLRDGPAPSTVSCPDEDLNSCYTNRCPWKRVARKNPTVWRQLGYFLMTSSKLPCSGGARGHGL